MPDRDLFSEVPDDGEDGEPQENGRPFDSPEDVEAAKQDGIGRAHRHADPEWKKQAWAAILAALATAEPFTADHVWAILDDRQVERPHTPAALGPLFIEAAKLGLIRKTGRHVSTRYKRRHHEMLEWIKDKP